MLSVDCEDMVNVLPFSIMVFMENKVSMPSRILIQVILGTGQPSKGQVRVRFCPLSTCVLLGFVTILGPSVIDQANL